MLHIVTLTFISKYAIFFLFHYHFFLFFSANSYFGLTTIGGAALSVALLSIPDLPWTLQAPSLLYIGWNILLALTRKISDRKRERLNSIANSFQTSLRLMQGLCSSMSKAMQFIQEMELIDRGFTLY